MLTQYGGKRVEVLNTDAEGRLVLADALVRAAEEEPDAIVDVATLTGAQIVALGMRTTGVMAQRRRLARGGGARRADAAGEDAWPMPLPKELRKGLDSPIADLANVPAGGNRDGGMLTAGHYLAAFVPDGLPWAHLDIAGPSWNAAGALRLHPQGRAPAWRPSLVTLLERQTADVPTRADRELHASISASRRARTRAPRAAADSSAVAGRDHTASLSVVTWQAWETGQNLHRACEGARWCQIRSTSSSSEPVAAGTPQPCAPPNSA